MSKCKLLLIVLLSNLITLTSTSYINARSSESDQKLESERMQSQLEEYSRIKPPQGFPKELWDKLIPELKFVYSQSWSNSTPEYKAKILQEITDSIREQKLREEQTIAERKVSESRIKEKRDSDERAKEEGKIYEAKRRAKEISDKANLDEAMISLTRELMKKYAPGHQLIDLKWGTNIIRLTTKYNNKMYTLEFTGGYIAAHDLSQVTIDHWSLSNSKSIDVE